MPDINQGSSDNAGKQPLSQNQINAIIVEDDDVFYYLFKKYLKLSSINAHIDRALEGREALQLFEQRMKEGSHYDLAFVDLNMPVMGGIELLKELSTTPGHITQTDYYVISSSAYPPELEKAKAMDIVKGVMIKPIDIEKITGIFKNIPHSEK